MKRRALLRIAKPTRKALMSLAFGAWVVYLGVKFMQWFEAGGAKKMADWSKK